MGLLGGKLLFTAPRNGENFLFVGAVWRAVAFRSPPRRKKLPVRGGSLEGSCFSQPPEKEKTSCSWGQSGGKLLFAAPREGKNFCFVGAAWLAVAFHSPPRREKPPVRGAACTRSVERVQINQNAEVVPEKGTPPALEQQNPIIWWKMPK